MAQVNIKLFGKEFNTESKTLLIYTAIIGTVLATLLFACCYSVKIGSSILREFLYFPAIVSKKHNPLLKGFAANLERKGKNG